MKKFTITETRPATYTWTYEVEAETKEQAIALIMDGYVDPINSDVEACDYSDSEYEVEELN